MDYNGRKFFFQENFKIKNTQCYYEYWILHFIHLLLVLPLEYDRHGMMPSRSYIETFAFKEINLIFEYIRIEVFLAWPPHEAGVGWGATESCHPPGDLLPTCLQTLCWGKLDSLEQSHALSFSCLSKLYSECASLKVSESLPLLITQRFFLSNRHQQSTAQPHRMHVCVYTHHTYFPISKIHYTLVCTLS